DHRAEGRQFADPAQYDRGPRLDHVDVCTDRLPNLVVPERLRVDRGHDLPDHLLVGGAQQLDEALLLAAELLIEGALRGAGVTHDVGDRGVPVSAFGYRLRETVEQPAAKRMPGAICADGSGGRGDSGDIKGHHAPPSGTRR